MFEGVDCIRQCSTSERQARVCELDECVVELTLVQWRDCGDEFVTELAPDRRADLRDLLDRYEAIQTCHK